MLVHWSNQAVSIRYDNQNKEMKETFSFLSRPPTKITQIYCIPCVYLFGLMFFGGLNAHLCLAQWTFWFKVLPGIFVFDTKKSVWYAGISCVFSWCISEYWSVVHSIIWLSQPQSQLNFHNKQSRQVLSNVYQKIIVKIYNLSWVMIVEDKVYKC